MKKMLFLLILTMVYWTGGVESVMIKTRAPHNRVIRIHYRVPRNYQPQSDEMCRVIVIFGGRNSNGRADASGQLGWGEWADRNNIFIVSPGFTDDRYWEPADWSGQALRKGLKAIRKQYKICTEKLLFYGYSAGSQCANLFPAWQPENTRAWVSHACGVFHEPAPRMKNIPGLVTCGDADTARYVISRGFVEQCRKKGIDIIWKSFPNHPHDVPPGSLALARAFLGYYHERHRDDLWSTNVINPVSEKEIFIGDDQEHKFYPLDSPVGHNILPEDRVRLPSRTIAEAWGREAK